MDPKLKEILDTQQGKTITVLSSLITVQEHLGYLPQESISAVAAYTGASVNDVYSVATFYTHFRFTPPGEHEIEVCWGASCHVLGAPKLMSCAEEQAGAKFDGTSKDNKFTLRRLSCAGACAQGPIAKIDHKFYGRMSEARLKEILSRLNGKKG